MQQRYYRLLADISLNGTVFFEAGSCVVETWLPGLGLPRGVLQEISVADGLAWFAADAARARYAAPRRPGGMNDGAPRRQATEHAGVVSPLMAGEDAAMANIKPEIHVTPHGDRWAVMQAREEDPLSVHDTQAEAIDTGRKQARRDEVELVVHGTDGRIREKDSEGNDPRDVPG